MGPASMEFLTLIIITDVAGTAEAINASLAKIGNDEVSIKIVASGVGGLTDSDANLAITTNSSLVGFNVRADDAAKKIIEKGGIELTYCSLIYGFLDDA
jgi:Translation initiation factor 2 (IF-2; GTPase)